MSYSDVTFMIDVTLLQQLASLSRRLFDAYQTGIRV